MPTPPTTHRCQVIPLLKPPAADFSIGSDPEFAALLKGCIPPRRYADPVAATAVISAQLQRHQAAQLRHAFTARTAPHSAPFDSAATVRDQSMQPVQAGPCRLPVPLTHRLAQSAAAAAARTHTRVEWAAWFGAFVVLGAIVTGAVMALISYATPCPGMLCAAAVMRPGPFGRWLRSHYLRYRIKHAQRDLRAQLQDQLELQVQHRDNHLEQAALQADADWLHRQIGVTRASIDAWAAEVDSLALEGRAQ